MAPRRVKLIARLNIPEEFILGMTGKV